MGNCSFKGAVNGAPDCIRVLTDSGDIVEFKGAKLARDVLSGYPGYGVFRQGHASVPLGDQEPLVGGRFYYLLPLEKPLVLPGREPSKQERSLAEETTRLQVESCCEPPKMSSVDYVENLGNGEAIEVLPSQKKGVWKVKLVINPKQLEEILSEEVNTEALIEKMRTAAAEAAASSGDSLTPRRSRSSWVVGLLPVGLSNVFKPPINNSITSCISS